MSGLSLDATCSLKRRWPEKADVRLDIDPAARPDVLANAERLPFTEGSFAEVWCDPPHFVRFDGDRAWVRQFDDALDPRRAKYSRFSAWPNRATWLRFCARSAREFARVLRVGGRLMYKVPDGSRSHRRVIDYREVIRALHMAGLTLETFNVSVSDGLLSRANVRRGRRPTLVFYLEFEKPGRPKKKPRGWYLTPAGIRAHVASRIRPSAPQSAAEIVTRHTASLRARLRDAFGGGCGWCGGPEEPERYGGRLEWAHVYPTGLDGLGRGSRHRLLDVARHPFSYVLVHKKPCHEEMGGPETWGPFPAPDRPAPAEPWDGPTVPGDDDLEDEEIAERGPYQAAIHEEGP